MKVENGIIASLGKAKGSIVYLESSKDISKVGSNSIVVANMFSKEYTEAIVKCIAFIATKGGLTSHAAIVCREMKKPCIVSCYDAFDIFPEGSKIELNVDNMEFIYTNDL